MAKILPFPSREPAPRPDDGPAVKVSEIFLSLQGEGPSAGVPAHFLRLQGCDVGCAWCDSKYTWDFAGGTEVAIEDLWRSLRALGEAPLLVVSGGEPLEHHGIDVLLAAAVENWAMVEVETSGLLPPPFRHERLFYNVSPKLPSATPRWVETWRNTPAWIEESNAVFKIVVGDPPDADDALRLIGEHQLPRERVLLMPEGLTDAKLRERALVLAETCKHAGLRMSPRLHVWLWGAKRGV
jgi:7-carboxy-7-deazaguanine synthase